MSNHGKNFQKLNRSLLYDIEMLKQLKHHIVFLTTYLKFKRLPKGFKLRFHSNMDGCSYDNILKNCSIKLMKRTVSHYKRSSNTIRKKIDTLSNTMIETFPDRAVYVRNANKKKELCLNPILENRRLRKFRIDDLDVPFAKKYYAYLAKSLFKHSENVETRASGPLKDNPHHPIVIINHGDFDIPLELKDLCAKGPTFVPTPLNFDWLQMQKDFDSLSSKVRARYVFSKIIPNDSNTTQLR